MQTTIWVSGLLCALLLAACDLPRDPLDSLDQLDSRPLRVGVAESAPWVKLSEDRSEVEADPSTTALRELSDQRVDGLEPTLVRVFANELGTSVSWRTGSEGNLLSALEHYELDLVVGRLTAETPWVGRVALTRPYLSSGAGSERRRHVWAVAPGENGLLMRVESFLERQRPMTLRLAEERGLASARAPE